MKSRADVTARVAELATRLERHRAKTLGPLVRVASVRVAVLDVLECGHELPADGNRDRRRCPACTTKRA